MPLAKCETTGHIGELKRDLIAVLSSASDISIRDLPRNVVGVGYGVRQGATMSAPAVRVYVRRKLPNAALRRSERIPPAVNGTATDVIEIGDVRALVLCGSPCSHHASEIGTVGCLVRRPKVSDAAYILSNHHVLGVVNQAIPGDPVFTFDDAGRSSVIARLTEFEPINFEGLNHIDAAIAEVTGKDAVSPGIIGIGNVRPSPVVASLNQRVRKHGSATYLTDGRVVDVAADINVRYGSRTAVFVNQVGIDGVGGAFALGGDSGSLVVDATTRRALALLFAGGARTAFANPIGAVLARFSAEIV